MAGLFAIPRVNRSSLANLFTQYLDENVADVISGLPVGCQNTTVDKGLNLIDERTKLIGCGIGVPLCQFSEDVLQLLGEGIALPVIERPSSTSA